VLATCLLAVVANPVLPTRVGYEPAPAATRLDWLGPRNCAQIAHAHMSSACHLSNLGHSVGYKRGPVTFRFIQPCEDDGGSVQQKMSELVIGIFERIAANISDNNNAPHSSSRGRDTVLTGATRAWTWHSRTQIICAALVCFVKIRPTRKSLSWSVVTLLWITGLDSKRKKNDEKSYGIHLILFKKKNKKN